MYIRDSWEGSHTVHGSIIFTRDSSIFQATGLPSPPGFVIVIPKYAPCSSGPWERPGSRYCRVISFYGPEGLRSAIKRMGLRERPDALYSSTMPYIAEEEISLVIEPREALASIIASSRYPEYVEVIGRILRASSIEVNSLGVTGSIAAGIAVTPISDVDLVVYGAENSARMLSYFKVYSRSSPPLVKTSHGGLRSSPIDMRWRRLVNSRFYVSWVGVGFRHERCKPLRSYWSIDPPKTGHLRRLTIEVKPYQETALLYPPCAKSREGLYLVSFEYNIGILLYEGGPISVEGVISESGDVLYLGLREAPGSIYKLTN